MNSKSKTLARALALIVAIFPISYFFAGKVDLQSGDIGAIAILALIVSAVSWAAWRAIKALIP